jgi:hypothetical protein
MKIDVAKIVGHDNLFSIAAFNSYGVATILPEITAS